ncbi:MAG TPA: response regulator [Patescibacteria group bacterium]|nr:response regulator [Patescibacteria group bacterium]
MINTILLIEDDLFVSDLYHRVLVKKGGFVVHTAMDGEEGLRMAKTKPTLILLDVMLPRINGIEVLKILKSDTNTKQIPVILLTNLGQETVIHEALKIGATDYLMKNRVPPYELVDYIHDFFKRKK